jgi:hypothetical protein
MVACDLAVEWPSWVTSTLASRLDMTAEAPLIPDGIAASQSTEQECRFLS